MPFFSSLCHLVWTNLAKNGALQAFIAHQIKACFAVYSIEHVGIAYYCQSASAGLRSTQALHFLQYLWLRPNQAWLILESFTRETVPSHGIQFFCQLVSANKQHAQMKKELWKPHIQKSCLCGRAWVRKDVSMFSPRLWHTDSFQDIHQTRRVLSFKISSLQEQHEPGPFRSQTLLYSVWLQGHSSSAVPFEVCNS